MIWCWHRGLFMPSILFPGGRSVRKWKNVNADLRANASSSNLITVIVPGRAKSENAKAVKTENVKVVMIEYMKRYPMLSREDMTYLNDYRLCPSWCRSSLFQYCLPHNYPPLNSCPNRPKLGNSEKYVRSNIRKENIRYILLLEWFASSLKSIQTKM